MFDLFKMPEDISLDPDYKFVIGDGATILTCQITSGSVVTLRNGLVGVVHSIHAVNHANGRTEKTSNSKDVAWIRVDFIPGFRSGMYVDQFGKGSQGLWYDIISVRSLEIFK
jgi:hypothetical protein